MVSSQKLLKLKFLDVEEVFFSHKNYTQSTDVYAVILEP